MAESDHSVKSLLEEVLVPEWSDGGSDIEIIQENVTRSSVNKNQKRRLKRTFPQSKKKNTVPNLQSVTDDSYTSVCGIKVSIKSLLQNEEIRKQIAPFIEKQIIIPNWSDSSDPEEVQKNRSTKSSSRKGRNKLKRPKQVNKPLTDHTYFVNKETSESITSTIEEGIVPEFLNITEIENIASMNIAVTEESGGSQNLPPYVEEEIIISNLPIDCSTSEVEQSVNENLQNTKENDLDIQESHITKNVEILDLVDSSDDEVVDKINTTDTRTVTEDRKNKSKLITNKTDHDQLVESDKTSDYYKCNYENFTVDENLFLANALENQKAAESSTIKTVDDQNLSLLDSDDWYYLNMSNVPNDKVELNKSKNVKVKPRKQTGRCKKKIGTKFRKNKDKIQLQGRIVKRSVKNTKTNVQNINSEPNLVSEESVIPDPLSLENATKEIKIDINENSSCETDIVSVIKEETILPDFVVTEATEDSKKNIANGELAFINTNNTSGNTQNNSRGLTLKPIIKSEEIAINFNKISEVTYENVSNETNTKMVPDMGWGKSDDENVEDFSNEQRKHSLKRKMKKSTLLTEWSIKTRNKKVKLLPELTMKTRNKKVKLLPELTMKTRSKKRKRLPELTMKTRNKKLTLLPELTKKTRNKKLKLVPELTMKTRKGKVKSIAESNIARTLHSEKKQRSYLGECSKCGKKYQKIGLLRIHESTCVRMQKEEIFKCVMCSYKTKGKDAFRNHLGNHILGTGYSKISSDNTIPVQKSVNLKLETEECGQVQEGYQSIALEEEMAGRLTNCIDGINVIKEEQLFRADEISAMNEMDCSSADSDTNTNAESPQSPSQPLSSDYEPEEDRPKKRMIPLAKKIEIYNLHQMYPKWKYSTLKVRGGRFVPRLDELARWKKDILNGGTRLDKSMYIKKSIYNRFCEARSENLPITNRNIQEWALQAAQKFANTDYHFVASLAWVNRFKKDFRIHKRKVTRYVEKVENRSLDEIRSNVENFQAECRQVTSSFNLDFVINTDQMEYEFRTSIERTLDHISQKTVEVCIDDANEVTYTYTVQYSVTASGKLLPKVLLCLQEESGKFAPKIETRMQILEENFKNVFLTCSKSGKLSTPLFASYITNVLHPYVNENEFTLILDSLKGQARPELFDTFKSSNESKCTLKYIPAGCTILCQPLDIYINRQIKFFIKKLQNCTFLLQRNRKINSREDVVKIHSLVHNQLSAPVLRNTIQYAWFSAKLIENRNIFLSVKEVCFPRTLNNCNCNQVSIIQCSWCKKPFCFPCFYDLYHPPNCNKYFINV